MEQCMLLRVVHILSTVFIETISVLFLVRIARFKCRDFFPKLHDGLEQSRDVDSEDDMDL